MQNTSNSNIYKTTIFILIAFIFSVASRLIWVFWASSYDEFFWNDQLMINTNDGYAFGEGARDMIAGFHQPNDLSYYGSPLSTITYIVFKLSPFSLESIMLYLSVFLSSFLVVPIILIARELGEQKAGFVAALIASVAHSYYNRTMAGYYDTDMLTIVLPMFVFWGLVRLHSQKDDISLILVALFMLFYSWYYPSSFALNSSIIGFYLLWTLVFDRTNAQNYKAILFMILAITDLHFGIKFALIISMFLLMLLAPKFTGKKANLGLNLLLAVLVVGGFVLCGGLEPIWFQLKFYIFRLVSDSSVDAFRYFNVNQTIMESSIIDLDLFARRISSSLVLFLLSLLGYIWLCFKHKIFLITLPMVALGFLALKGGLRFTIYAVPLMAIGFGFLLSYISVYFKSKRYLFAAIICLVSLAALAPSFIHILGYKPLTVLTNSEVKALDKLKSIASRQDYALAWWDYGYAIRYYSDIKTLIDGGKHLGKENFAVSFALLKDQLSSANIARLEVEYTEKSYKEKFNSNLTQMMKDYGFEDVNSFLSSLGLRSFEPPKPSRDIYYYLPDRMLGILPVVSKFSNLDLKDGKEFGDIFFVSSSSFSQDDEAIHLSQGIDIANDATSVSFGGSSYKVHSFVQTSYDKNANLQVQNRLIDQNGLLYLVYMSDYGRFLLLDKRAFNSTYIQLFVLENYDKSLFEPVVLSPNSKIYKLKR